MVEHSVHTRSVICSSQIAATRPVGQAVKTPPFHGGNMGSIPVRVTKKYNHHLMVVFFYVPYTEADTSGSNANISHRRWVPCPHGRLLRSKSKCAASRRRHSRRSIPVRVTKTGNLRRKVAGFPFQQQKMPPVSRRHFLYMFTQDQQQPQLLSPQP